MVKDSGVKWESSGREATGQVLGSLRKGAQHAADSPCGHALQPSDASWPPGKAELLEHSRWVPGFLRPREWGQVPNSTGAGRHRLSPG